LSWFFNYEHTLRYATHTQDLLWSCWDHTSTQKTTYGGPSAHRTPASQAGPST